MDQNARKILLFNQKSILYGQWMDNDDNGLLSKDYWKTIKDKDNHQRTIGRLWLIIFDCLLDVFLVLEDIQWGRNSGKCIRMQGKYLSLIRRVSLKNNGDCWKTVDYYQRIIERQRQRQRQWLINGRQSSKTMEDKDWSLEIIEDYDQRLKDYDWFFEDYPWLWRIIVWSSAQLS